MFIQFCLYLFKTVTALENLLVKCTSNKLDKQLIMICSLFIFLILLLPGGNDYNYKLYMLSFKDSHY